MRNNTFILSAFVVVSQLDPETRDARDARRDTSMNLPLSRGVKKCRVQRKFSNRSSDVVQRKITSQESPCFRRSPYVIQTFSA